MSLNSDNIISKVARVSLLERDSPKTGKPYVVMTIHFKNGLQIDNFVDKRDWFGLQDLLDNTNKNRTYSDEYLELETSNAIPYFFFFGNFLSKVVRSA